MHVTGRIVLFGVGSPLVADYEETCRRLGVAIAAAVRNRPGETYVTAVPTIELRELNEHIRATPCLCPLFTPANRRTAWGEAQAAGFSAASALVDPTSIVASSTTVELGSYINAGCTIGAAGRMGSQVIVNRGSSVGHHVFIGSFASIGPGVTIAGQVEIGEDAMIGAGAVVLPKVRIGRGAVVGAGAVVIRDVPDLVTVVGPPARPLTSSA
jgi:sugar O-acyltransferase (sialic acid O-acetyltransferase NeuD family)